MMRRVAHLSDLHFGTEEPSIAAGILRDLAEVRPHLAVVTGDLTQRARRAEFRAAREFLDRIPAPQVVVPGNHDIPLYNIAARFGWPLAGFRTFITDDLHPTFQDEELAVTGVNTARSNTWKDGRISVDDIALLRVFFCGQSPQAFKILAAHHPFIPPVRDPSAALVGRAVQALGALASYGCHLILAGHLHEGYAGDVRPHHVEIEQSILVVQAGTAISRRRRGEANAYNLLTIDQNLVRLEIRAWNGCEFAPAGVTEYANGEGGWDVQRQK
jgi:3',5'-cyclic AMP phosphodiesterase CpdA